MTLDELKESKRAIEQSLGPEVRSLTDKVNLLERNNESLSVMYQT